MAVRSVVRILSLVHLLLLLCAPAHAQDQPQRVGDVETWQDVPPALAATYRRQRLIGSSLSLASGSAAITAGVLDLTGAVDIDGTDGAVFGALLLGGGLGTVTVGVIGITRPLSDAEVDAQRMYDEGATDAEIREWLEDRRTLARRDRIVRAAGIGGTGVGVLLSAALLRDDTSASQVPGFDAVEDTGINLGRTRVVLAIIGGAQIGAALFVALRPGPEDRILRRLESGDLARRPVRLTLAPTGLRLRW